METSTITRNTNSLLSQNMNILHCELLVRAQYQYPGYMYMYTFFQNKHPLILFKQLLIRKVNIIISILNRFKEDLEK